MRERLIVATQATRTRAECFVDSVQRFVIPPNATEGVGKEDEMVRRDHERAHFLSPLNRGEHLLDTSFVTGRSSDPPEAVTCEVEGLGKLMLLRQREFLVRELAQPSEMGSNDPCRRYLMTQCLRH